MLEFVLAAAGIGVGIVGLIVLGAKYEDWAQVWLEARALRAYADEHGREAAIAKSDREIAHFRERLELARLELSEGFAGPAGRGTKRTEDHPEALRQQISVRERARARALGDG